MSAKQDNLIIKDYENRGDTYVTVFIDNFQLYFNKDVDRRLEDKIVDMAVCMVNYCLDQRVEVVLETQKNQQSIRISGQQKSDLKPFLTAMALFKGNGASNFKDFMETRAETIRKGTTVIIITPCLDKSMGAQGIKLKMSNLNPLWPYRCRYREKAETRGNKPLHHRSPYQYQGSNGGTVWISNRSAGTI